MSEEQYSKINKKYMLVTPEGGWGYMICVAVTVNFVTTTGFIGCFGMLFNDFMEEIGMTSTQVTLLTGIGAICLAVSGFLTSPLLKILSMRKLAFVATLIFDLGVFGTVFMKSQFPFFICYGVMQGTGLGVCYNISCTILNEYFVKRRLLANGIVQAVTALCTMFAPTICSWALNKYGFRGTLLLITGISLQNLVASFMMQPVKWHMKKIEIDGHDEKELMLVEETKNGSTDTPMVKMTDLERNVKGSVENVYEFPPDPKKSKGLRRFLETVIDLSLCKTFLVSSACIGTSLNYVADSTYTVILPQALYADDWDQDSVAWALSSLLVGDLAIRIVLTFASKWFIVIGSQGVFLIGVLIGLISRLGMLWSTNHIAIIINIGLMGVSHGVYSVLLSVVIADAVAPEQFTSAMGMTLLVCGIMNLILGPAVGVIRDLTNSYNAAFYVLACMYALVLIFWSIEIIYKRNEYKRKAIGESLKLDNKLSQSNKAK